MAHVAIQLLVQQAKVVFRLESEDSMKSPLVLVLLATLSSIPAFAAPAKDQYNVKVSGGNAKAEVGDKLQLTLKPDSITAVDKTCIPVRDNFSGNVDCQADSKDVVAAQFPTSAITEVTAGEAAHFVSVTWVSDGQKGTLIFEADRKDYASIVGFLEGVTGKKAVNADAQITDRPRVLLRSQSYGNQKNALRDQSMEMADDFKKVCPTVQITINEQRADFTVALNHIEGGLFVRDNQVEVYDKDGDLISGKEGGSIADQVKAACGLITKEWTAHSK
jgi:hypothetical protein